MSEFERQLDPEEIDFLGSLYDDIDVQQGKTVEEEIRGLESRYTDRNYLAEGGLKIIESARDILTGREVALAIPRDSEDTIIREKFFREARLTASLQHPNIIPVYDLGLDNDQPYFAMKLIKGESLKSLNEKGTLSLSEKLSIFMKVCDAMSYAHSRETVHLDLKPDNIQISSYGEVSVCDWGLAKVRGGHEKPGEISKSLDKFEVENMTVDGVVKGTPGYMAPEQINSGPKTFQTDIYALGAILFEMLYSKTPVQGDDVMDLLKNTVIGNLSIPRDEVPVPLKAVALRALSTEASARYQSIVDLQKEIRNYQSGHATKAENAGLSRMFYLLLMRNKALSTTMAVSMVILIASTLQFISSLQESEKEARNLLFELQQENKKKLELAEDAEPRLTAKIIAEMNAYKLIEAEESINKLVQLLPSSHKGFLFKGRLAFLKGDLEKSHQFLGKPENDLDKALLRYLKSARQQENKIEFIDRLYELHDHGAMKYLRSFYMSSEGRGVKSYLESTAAKWRFVQDCWHILEIAKHTNEDAKTELLKGVYNLLSNSNWDETPELAHEAVRIIDDIEFRERFLKLFTRNIALMKKIEASGSTLNPVYHAVDGKKLKVSNRWEAGPCPVYMTVDLGETRPFNKILIYFKRSTESNFQYTVSFSANGTDFTQIIDASKNKHSEQLKPLTHRFPTVTGRFIRLTVLSSNDSNRAYVREFEVYEEVKNMAVGQFCSQKKTVLENLTNGSSYIGDYTEIERGVPVFIDLGEIREFGAVKPAFKNRKIRPGYSLASSLDGKVFTTLKPIDFDELHWQEYEPVKGRYLRFIFTGEEPVLINEIRVRKP